MPKIEDFLKEDNIFTCNYGDDKSNYKPSEKSMKVSGKNIANEEDNIAGDNIFSFGYCSKIGKKCKLETELRGEKLEWVNRYKGVVFWGQTSVWKDSKLKCPFGGIIERED